MRELSAKIKPYSLCGVDCFDINENGDYYVTVDGFKKLSFDRFKKVSDNRKKYSKEYYDIICSFDIETTTVEPPKDSNGDYIGDKRPYGFMYIWQFAFENLCIMGRTWEEFKDLLQHLHDRFKLSDKRNIVIYVHNLAYEFQFMRNFIDYEKGFFQHKRKPLKVESELGIEFRCSYMLTNMGLGLLTQSTKTCAHKKLDGEDFDYGVYRTPFTELSDTELCYCYNDVIGLNECINDMLNKNNDTLATIPMTNTGYVRRDVRGAMNTNPKNRDLFVQTQLDITLYQKMKQAFRGGNTHANRARANTVIPNVYSFDITSSYPSRLMMSEFPMGKFEKVEIKTTKHLEYSMYKMCSIYTVEFTNIRCKPHNYCPYIDIAHCSKRGNILNDNGRVLSADLVEITLTNIDLHIILNTYDYDNISIKDCYSATKGKLPKEFRETVLKFYDYKTIYKGSEDPVEIDLYMKSKNRLNSLFGMAVSDIIHDEVEFCMETGEYSQTQGTEEELIKYYDNPNNCLPYQWGVWCTAYARLYLQKIIDIVGDSFIYCDTDSCKFDDQAKIELINKLNDEILEEVYNNDIRSYSTTPKGVKKPLAIFDCESELGENEPTYKNFKTIGAKKYCGEEFIHDGTTKFVITVAGMGKKKGAKRIESAAEKRGKTPFDIFAIGEVYHDVGRTVSYYCDRTDIYKETCNQTGQTFTSSSSLGIVDTTYKMGVTNEYAEILGFYEHLA